MDGLNFKVVLGVSALPMPDSVSEVIFEDLAARLHGGCTSGIYFWSCFCVTLAAVCVCRE